MMDTGLTSRGPNTRRTSQGNRTYLDAKREFPLPVTHHMGMRNYRTVSNKIDVSYALSISGHPLNIFLP